MLIFFKANMVQPECDDASERSNSVRRKRKLSPDMKSTVIQSSSTCSEAAAAQVAEQVPDVGVLCPGINF